MSCYRTGLFDNVDVKVKPMKKGKSQVRFVFREKVWPEMQSFRVAASGESVPISSCHCSLAANDYFLPGTMLHSLSYTPACAETSQKLSCWLLACGH